MDVTQAGGFKTVCLLACLLWPAIALSATDGKHVGVASCAGSTCHGSTRPFADVKIAQNEYLVWQRQDRHAQSYATLRSDRSQRIAANLGLGKATDSTECLTCHSDVPPPAMRAKGHQVADGVGCEACHGGAERWMARHTSGFSSNQERQGAGLFPLWEPATRALRCQSCHLGDNQRPMTHRLLGAGHPPLRFELDTYQAVMPPHHVVDSDYVQRKGRSDSARNWVEGQSAAAALLLGNLAAQEGRGGRFPELAAYDCSACHHSLKVLRWRNGIAAALPPGTVRLADTPLFQMGLWLDVVNPALGRRWSGALAELHVASQASPPALGGPIKGLQSLLEGEVRPSLAADLDPGKLFQVLKRLLAEHRSGPSGNDFSRSEQLAMSSAVLFTALVDRNYVRVTPEWKSALDALFASVRDRDRFEPAELRRAAAAAEDALLKSLLKATPRG